MIVNAGYDLICDNTANPTQPAPAKYMALTANATAAAATDTTLTAEIVTGGGGLIRVASVYAHTTTTKIFTLTKTFTVNGSDTIPVTIAKFGIFNAASSGSLFCENVLAATATLSAIGDQLTITETVTFS
jgi:hypothetical protein